MQSRPSIWSLIHLPQAWNPGNELKPEIDFLVKKKQLKQILEKVINTHGAIQTAITLDDIKAIGYKYSTRAAMTVSISDMTVPATKKQLLHQPSHYGW